jgi:hypothetical protein
MKRYKWCHGAKSGVKVVQTMVQWCKPPCVAGVFLEGLNGFFKAQFVAETRYTVLSIFFKI